MFTYKNIKRSVNNRSSRLEWNKQRDLTGIYKKTTLYKSPAIFFQWKIVHSMSMNKMLKPTIENAMNGILLHPVIAHSHLNMNSMIKSTIVNTMNGILLHPIIAHTYLNSHSRIKYTIIIKFRRCSNNILPFFTIFEERKKFIDLTIFPFIYITIEYHPYPNNLRRKTISIDLTIFLLDNRVPLM